MATTNDYALLSLSAYENLAKNAMVGDWKKLDFFTGNGTDGFYAAAYEKAGEIVISYRGTDDAQDGVADVDIFLGLPVEQLALAQAFYDAVRASNPSASISLAGHSLGGGLASAIAVRENLQATTFAAVPMVDTVQASLGGYVSSLNGLPIWEIPPAN